MSSYNVMNNKICKSRLTIQDGFLATGEISKSMDGRGTNSCPDLHAMINCTKNDDMLSNANDFMDKACEMSRLYIKQGECTELQCGTVLKIDACLDNIPRELKFTCKKIHLMRSIVLCHFCLRKREMDRLKDLTEKRRQDTIKKCDKTKTCSN